MRIKILVVDDEKDIEPLFLQKFRKELKAGGLSFHFSFSGAEALAYLRGENGSGLVLILSDINMPGMSGLELLKHIKKLRPDLPVFMITAYGDDAKRRAAFENGAQDYLAKPIDFDLLKQKIRALRAENQGQPTNAHDNTGR